MQIVPQDNSWLQVLMQWAALEEQAANRIEHRRQAMEKERQMQLAVDRTMGDVGQTAQRLGYTPRFTNPLYNERPEIDRNALALAQLKDITGQNPLAAVNDQTKNVQPLTYTGPDGKTYTSYDATDQPTPAFESLPASKQNAARQQGGLDILLAMKKGGLIPGEVSGSNQTLQAIANMGQGFKQIQTDEQGRVLKDENGRPLLTAQGQVELGLPQEIEGARKKIGEQAVALEQWQRSPSRQEKYLEGGTAGELQQNIIRAYNEALPFAKSQQDRLRIFALAHNAMIDVGKAFNRMPGERDIFDPNLIMGMGGGGTRKEITVQAEIIDPKTREKTTETFPLSFIQRQGNESYNQALARQLGKKVGKMNYTTGKPTASEAEEIKADLMEIAKDQKAADNMSNDAAKAFLENQGWEYETTFFGKPKITKRKAIMNYQEAMPSVSPNYKGPAMDANSYLQNLYKKK